MCCDDVGHSSEKKFVGTLFVEGFFVVLVVNGVNDDVPTELKIFAFATFDGHIITMTAGRIASRRQTGVAKESTKWLLC